MRRTAGVSRQTAQRWPGRGVSWRGLFIPGSKASAVIRRPLVSCSWIGCRRCGSAHVALAPCKLPPARDAPTQGRASLLVVRCAVTAPPGGGRSCPSVDICSRHGACSTGTRAPGSVGVGWRIPPGLGKVTARCPTSRSVSATSPFRTGHATFTASGSVLSDQSSSLLCGMVYILVGGCPCDQPPLGL